MRLQVDDRVRKMVWPSLQADFMLVETYKVGLDCAGVCRGAAVLLLNCELSALLVQSVNLDR